MEIIELLKERNKLKFDLEVILLKNISQEKEIYDQKEDFKLVKIDQERLNSVIKKLEEEKYKLREAKNAGVIELDGLKKDLDEYKSKNYNLNTIIINLKDEIRESHEQQVAKQELALVKEIHESTLNKLNNEIQILKEENESLIK